MIINILIILAFVAMWLYSIRFIFPPRIVSRIPKKKVFTPAKVTAVDKDEEKKKKDKKPRRICKGWSNHGMLGKRGYR